MYYLIDTYFQETLENHGQDKRPLIVSFVGQPVLRNKVRFINRIPQEGTNVHHNIDILILLYFGSRQHQLRIFIIC